MALEPISLLSGTTCSSAAWLQWHPRTHQPAPPAAPPAAHLFKSLNHAREKLEGTQAAGGHTVWFEPH